MLDRSSVSHVQPETRPSTVDRSRRIVWLSLPVFALICVTLFQPIPHLDFWWHLKAGEIIVESGSIPRTDSFSFTAEGETYILQNWLTEVYYYLAYRLGGLEMLIVLNSLIIALAFLPSFALCRRFAPNLPSALAGASLAFYALFLFGTMRPSGMSIVMFSAFYWVLYRYSRGEDARIWALAPLMALWVNLHGAFVLGLILISLFLICDSVRCALAQGAPAKPHPSWKGVGKLATVLALCLAATGLNPEGFRVWEYVRTVASDPVSQAFISEWQPPSIRTFKGLMLFHFPVFLFLSVLLYSRRKLNLTEFAVYFFFAAFALSAIRNAIWLHLVSAPIFAQAIAGIDWRLGLGRFEELSGLGRIRFSKARRASVAEGSTFLQAILLAMLLVLFVLSTPWFGNWVGARQQLHTAHTPVKAVEFLAENPVQGRIFHHQRFGDYLIWRLWPQHKSFFDGRVHLFGREIHYDYRLILSGEGWKPRLDQYEIDYILLPTQPEGGFQLLQEVRRSKEWRVLYEDEQAVLFERTKPVRVSFNTMRKSDAK